MFKFEQKKRVWWPVTISAPSDDGSGQTVEYKIKVRFELMERSEARQVEADLSLASDALSRKILGWDGVTDENGEAFEFNDDNLNALLDIAYIERAFAIGLIQASNGAAAKN